MLRHKIVEFVAKGDFGLASGARPDGGYDRLWYDEQVGADEVAFESRVFLVAKAKAQALRSASEIPLQPGPEPAATMAGTTAPTPVPAPAGVPGGPTPPIAPKPPPRPTQLHLAGIVPPESWNRLGTRLLPKLRSGDALTVNIALSLSVGSTQADSMEAEIEQILKDLNLDGKVRVERS